MSALPEPTFGAGIHVASLSTPAEMTPEELKLREQIIAVGRLKFIEVGTALLEIRDRKGYRFGYKTFEEYCEKKWDFSRRHAYRLMDAAEIATDPNVTQWVTPENERQARDIKQVGLEAIQQAAADPVKVPLDDDWNERAVPQNGSKPHEHMVARGAKEIIAKAKEIKAKVKADKREARKEELKTKAASFKGIAVVGSVEIHCADSRQLGEFVKPKSVQLVVTSPPYNVGIEYANHDDAMPWGKYLELLKDVFLECKTAMVDGARIAVVVPFGVGRNPYKLIAAPLDEMLRRTGFTLRGWLVWDKSASGKTAWGSFRLPTNPNFRDTCECIIVAHKVKDSLYIPKECIIEDDKGTHSPFLADANEFMELATGYWKIRPESAESIGHPAPFPVELASRLIRLYAYPGAMILDPFAGSGTTGVAAQKLGCNATLVDIDSGYCQLARERLEK